MSKKIGYGSSIGIAPTTTGPYVTVAQVSNITPGEASGDAVETTTLDSSSNFRTFAGGLVDPGDCTFDLVYDQNLTSMKELSARLADRVVSSFQLTYNTTGTATQEFDGIVNGLGPEIPLDDLMTASVTIKKSGIPGFLDTT